MTKLLLLVVVSFLLGVWVSATWIRWTLHRHLDQKGRCPVCKAFHHAYDTCQGCGEEQSAATLYALCSECFFDHVAGEE